MALLTYFAYGSNMLTERLRRRVPSAHPIGSARLDDWALRFHKHGQDGSAKCNIVKADGGVVHGVIFEIEPGERYLLDEAEGLGCGYELARVDVHREGREHDAFCYVASEHYIEPSLAPFEWYLDFVRHGAAEHGLPLDYRRRFEQLEALDDERRSRAQKNRSILAAGAAHVEETVLV
ncbi:MAG: gamma-glutamylcyclotransferase family protein [Persicimonas sp.]